MLVDTNLFRFFKIFFKMEGVLRYSGSVFFNIIYPANARWFSAYGNSTFLARAILLLLEIISIIKRDSISFVRQLETYILTKSFILASWNRFSIFFNFLRQQSTAACGNKSFFNWNIFFSQFFTLASVNEFFVYWKHYYYYYYFYSYHESGFLSHIYIKVNRLFTPVKVLFYSEFFLLVETIINTWGKSIFKDKIYSC